MVNELAIGARVYGGWVAICNTCAPAGEAFKTIGLNVDRAIDKCAACGGDLRDGYNPIRLEEIGRYRR